MDTLDEELKKARKRMYREKWMEENHLTDAILYMRKKAKNPEKVKKSQRKNNARQKYKRNLAKAVKLGIADENGQYLIEDLVLKIAEFKKNRMRQKTKKLPLVGPLRERQKVYCRRYYKKHKEEIRLKRVNDVEFRAKESKRIIANKKKKATLDFAGEMGLSPEALEKLEEGFKDG